MFGLMLATVLSGWSAPVTVNGTIDGKARSGALHVYVPSKPGPHPLMIALHGWNHSPELWREKGDLGALAEKFGFVVAVPAMGKSVYEAQGTRWVGDVVLPYVRAHHAVGKAVVVGYSTGGRGALMVAQAYPGSFVFVGSLSGTYDLMALDPGEGEYKIHAAVYGARDAFKGRWEADNVASPARLSKLKGVKVYLAHGGKDRVVNPKQLEAMAAVEAERVLVPDAGHDWAFWNAQWPAVFERAADAVGQRR